DERALIGGRQEARTPERRSLRGLRRADDQVAGQVLVLAAQSIEQPGAQAGARERLFPCVHLQACAVMVDVVRDHRANDSDVVSTSRRVKAIARRLCAGSVSFILISPPLGYNPHSVTSQNVEPLCYGMNRSLSSRQR